MNVKQLMWALLWCSAPMMAQDYFPNNEGVKNENHNFRAFTNATIYVSADQVVKNGTLLIQNGKVAGVGKSVNIPANAIVTDLEGKSIYPSFIDIYSDFGVEKPKKASGSGRSPQYQQSREGFYWNDHIMPEKNAITSFSYTDKDAASLRKVGFGVVNTHINDGIARGTGALIALNKHGNDADRVLEDRSAQYFSLDKSVASRQSYPTSLMGSLALLRQMYVDADWYAQGHVATTDRSLEALNRNKGLVSIFAAKDKGNALRADKIGDAQGIQYVILGGGNEFEWIDDIKATGATYILPLNFPDAYDVSNPHQARYVSLHDMRLWNQKPANPKIMADKAIPFAFTLNGLKKKDDFFKNLQKAISYGLSEKEALRALTSRPAEILGMQDKVGSLEQGKWANFLISSGPIFDSATTLYENWVQGQKHSINTLDVVDIRGEYDLNLNGLTYQLNITGTPAKPKAEVKQDTNKVKSKLNYADNWMHLNLQQGKGDQKKMYRFNALASTGGGNLTGTYVDSNGKEASFTALKTKAYETKDPDAAKKTVKSITPLTFPNVGYGYNERPKAENFLFKNATVWTGEAAGVLENTDVLVKKGKIVKIGTNLGAGGATVVDATGKHLTAGIVDEHSHIALLSVNEAGQNSSAEVSMEDVVDPEDIDIYRNLAGGVTTMQLLHGSANPIGGRSAIIKLKWGSSADDMIYDHSPKFIKFALGENVKQSNWQSFSRFPQTRMGVEQAFVNYFQQAKEYQALKKSGQPYRKDVEMETLVEIMNGERFISCHSYVQSEINMLMKVADKFGFRVNTFTHILEGYKVADKMAEHGVGGSTFSDWWAYKYEVNDAIPYNAAIMQRQGITVAINSDDAEMSRRLNQEAAKTVKYGGMSEEEAWKMVTINPAKLLHLDHRVGSIKEGKDADLVLWNDHPLSVYAKAEKTLIEGAVYFDLEKDAQQRTAVKKERNDLIQQMLDAKAGGSPTQSPKMAKKEHFHCDSL